MQNNFSYCFYPKTLSLGDLLIFIFIYLLLYFCTCSLNLSKKDYRLIVSSKIMHLMNPKLSPNLLVQSNLCKIHANKMHYLCSNAAMLHYVRFHLQVSSDLPFYPLNLEILLFLFLVASAIEYNSLFPSQFLGFSSSSPFCLPKARYIYLLLRKTFTAYVSSSQYNLSQYSID